jgi:hypothetical protein
MPAPKKDYDGLFVWDQVLVSDARMCRPSNACTIIRYIVRTYKAENLAVIPYDSMLQTVLDVHEMGFLNAEDKSY